MGAMGIKQITTCDVCGVSKIESNHWFEVQAQGEWSIMSLEPYEYGKVVCGEACAHKLLSQWFDGQRPQEKFVERGLEELKENDRLVGERRKDAESGDGR